MTRKCLKCKEDLIPNAKLGLMECVSGKHIEPIRLNGKLYWNQCPSCGQMGVNEVNGEAYLQKIEKKEVEVIKDGVRSTKTLKVPVIEKKGKKNIIVFEKNLNQVPVECKSCGKSFTKTRALN